MKTTFTPLRVCALLSLLHCFIGYTMGATAPVPSVVEKGLQLLKTAGPTPALEALFAGGITDDPAKTRIEAFKLKELIKPLKNYRSYEVLEVKEIGKTSKIVYVSMTFERGVLYGSFLVWKSDRDWIVQRSQFDTQPEAIMPWLAPGGMRVGS